MRRNFFGRCIGAGLLIAGGVKHASGTVLPTERTGTALASRIRQLLAAYSANRPDDVIAMLDHDGWVVFGSDVSEIVHTEVALRQMMEADFALWKTAAFGEIRDLEVRAEGVLATAMFHVDFSVAGRPGIPVRFCTTWHRVRGAWMLSQCANTVPTVHSSAAELLHR